jgi:hypothetical protein
MGAAFDLWAWQFMWILGLWLGVRWAKGDLPFESWAKRFTIPGAFIFYSSLRQRTSIVAARWYRTVVLVVYGDFCEQRLSLLGKSGQRFVPVGL